MNKDGTVKVNSRVRLLLKLEVKGGSYFRGTCGDFGQFGHVSCSRSGSTTAIARRGHGPPDAACRMHASTAASL